LKSKNCRVRLPDSLPRTRPQTLNEIQLETLLSLSKIVDL
jgi:hypothetical protein